MSYDLRPRNRRAGTLSLGAFLWPWMLDLGVGMPIGHVVRPRPDDALPLVWHDYRLVRGVLVGPTTNDGYPVTAAEARAMALCADALVAIERLRLREWDARPANDRPDWARPVRADFIDKMEAFARWAPKSGGFRVY